MHTYQECEAHYRSYCGYGDPSIVIAFLLKEIRCRDNRITAYEDEVSDLKVTIEHMGFNPCKKIEDK